MDEKYLLMMVKAIDDASYLELPGIVEQIYTSGFLAAQEACLKAARVQIDKTMRKKENVGKWFPDLPEIVAAIKSVKVEAS